MRSAVIVAVVAALMVASCKRGGTSGEPDIIEVPVPPKAVPCALDPGVAETPCGRAVDYLYDRCGGRVEEIACEDAAAQCVAAPENAPWACVRKCAEAYKECGEFPECLISCVQDGAGPGAPEAPADMVAIPGGWSIMRFSGERWEGRNKRFKMLRVETFAMDRYEFPNARGEKPVHGSWNDANAACAAVGKRLCTWAEWQKVCGENRGQAYPYEGDADASACNMLPCDQPEPDGTVAACGANPLCRGRYGVYDLIGNMSEYLADRWDEETEDRMIAGDRSTRTAATTRAGSRRGAGPLKIMETTAPRSTTTRRTPPTTTTAGAAAKTCPPNKNGTPGGAPRSIKNLLEPVQNPP
ncbi:MAG: formylglycine-generating enzyme family protein [Deltaproteobacteria bacterium]|nr:formylglycine-generating enzyme family protein [Deltaproteobacteria bacterium]